MLRMDDLLLDSEAYKGSSVPYVQARKAGYAVSEHGESGYKWAVYSRASVESAYGPITEENAEDIAGNLTGWGPHYSGPGRGFSHDPYIRVLKRNVLVKQFCGLDI